MVERIGISLVLPGFAKGLNSLNTLNNCGNFKTTRISTFSVETVHLITDSKWGTAILYVLLSLWGGLLSSWLGYRLGMVVDKEEKSILSKIGVESKWY
jgi:fluoride ion exporter CrcB/FEX